MKLFDAPAGHRAPCDIVPADLQSNVAKLLNKIEQEQERQVSGNSAARSAIPENQSTFSGN